NTLQWTVSGYEDTLDHYRVFISTDGQHLMPLTTMAVGSRSLNLCSYTLEQRSYVLFVEGIGRPTIRNRMSRAIAYTPHCSAGTARNLWICGAPVSSHICGVRGDFSTHSDLA